jgi:hypothetical protein
MKSPSPRAVDIRTPEMKARESYFTNLATSPGAGYDIRRMAVLEPVKERYAKEAMEMASSALSQSGISPFSGIGAHRRSQVGRGVAEDFAKTEFQDRANWENWVMRGSEGTPMVAYQPAPSPFAQMIGGLLGGFGSAIGGPLGGMAARGVGSLIGPKPSTSYGSTSIYVR